MSLMHKEFMMLAEDLEKNACIHLTEEKDRIKKIPIVLEGLKLEISDKSRSKVHEIMKWEKTVENILALRGWEKESMMKWWKNSVEDNRMVFYKIFLQQRNESNNHHH